MLWCMFCLLLNEGSVDSWGSLLARVFLCDVVACLLTLPVDTHSCERSCSLAEASCVLSLAKTDRNVVVFGRKRVFRVTYWFKLTMLCGSIGLG